MDPVTRAALVKEALIGCCVLDLFSAKCDRTLNALGYRPTDRWFG
jgi:hypothetical protein